jgi:hypothetical protein
VYLDVAVLEPTAFTVCKDVTTAILKKKHDKTNAAAPVAALKSKLS